MPGTGSQGRAYKRKRYPSGERRTTEGYQRSMTLIERASSRQSELATRRRRYETSLVGWVTGSRHSPPPEREVKTARNRCKELCQSGV